MLSLGHVPNVKEDLEMLPLDVADVAVILLDQNLRVVTQILANVTAILELQESPVINACPYFMGLEAR